MAILYHPKIGSILICNFDTGFKEPEMVKRRPVLVISPKIALRSGLCTVLALSTTDPFPVMPYHSMLRLDEKLPSPWDSESMWIKGDMVYTVGYHRLDFASFGKDKDGKRIIYKHVVRLDQLRDARSCVLKSIGLDALTKLL